MVQVTLTSGPLQDLQYIQNNPYTQTFQFTENGSVLLFTAGEELHLRVYSLVDGTLLYDITGSINHTTGVISFSLTSTHTQNLGNFEYRVFKLVTGDPEVLLTWGRISVITPFNLINSIDSFLLAELPMGLTLRPEFKIQKLAYWRLFLKDSFTPAIPESSLDDATLWSPLANSLIAKLIFYDALLLAAKGSLIAFLFGGSISSNEGGQPGVKSITTGPATVEYFEGNKIIEGLFKSNNGGLSAFNILQQDICMLTSKLGIHLSICPPQKIVIVPKIGR